MKLDQIVPGEPEISASEELREAYYLSEQCRYFSLFSEDEETAAAHVEEMKQKSHLIWKKKE